MNYGDLYQPWLADADVLTIRNHVEARRLAKRLNSPDIREVVRKDDGDLTTSGYPGRPHPVENQNQLPGF